MEECGKPIDADEMDLKQRCVLLTCLTLFDAHAHAHASPHAHSETCCGFFERLHAEGFLQSSPYARNVLTQPGPLSLPREERSNASPSFRIIDFGRGDEPWTLRRTQREPMFGGLCEDELRRARKMLML